MAHVFLDPGGMRANELHLIVEATTGVTYQEQCMGLWCEQRMLEGFLIPLFRSSKPLIQFFVRFQGWPPGAPKHGWTEPDIRTLIAVVERLNMWWTFPPNSEQSDEPFTLQLDLSRIAETTEAWIRVLTPYRPGILVFAHGD